MKCDRCGEEAEKTVNRGLEEVCLDCLDKEPEEAKTEEEIRGLYAKEAPEASDS